MKSFAVKKEYKLVALPILCWGTLAALNKILLGSMDAMFVLAASSLIASVVLLVYNLWSGRLKMLRTYPAAAIARMGALGVIGFFFYNLLYLCGIDLLPAQKAMIINYLWPAMIIVFSSIVLKEKMTLKKIVATMLSLFGVVIVATQGNLNHLLSGNLKGSIFCFLAAVAYGLYSVLNKKETFDKSIALMIGYAVTAMLASGCLLFTGAKITLHVLPLIGILYIGIACYAAAYLLWILALDCGNTAVISNLAYLTPFLSLIFCHFLLHEKISGYSVIGLFLIVLGILIQSMKFPFRNRQEAHIQDTI